MKWYLDTEFAENGSTIKLISIALVSELGEELYFTASDGWSEDDCDDWVKENVLPKVLPPSIRTPRKRIASQIRATLLRDGDKPEIWAYYADYDWVAFCQLFGRMIDLPAGMPMYCRDLRQWLDERDLKSVKQPEDGQAHDALHDARWARDTHLDWLRGETRAPEPEEQAECLGCGAELGYVGVDDYCARCVVEP